MALIKISEPIAESSSNQSHEIVVGIDLGTTNSLIAIIENQKIRFFCDEKGNDIIPSLVTYNDVKISSIKRLMGKGYEDVKNLELPFKINPELNQKEALQIVIGENKVTPAQISSYILNYLKTLAEETLKTEIKKAVITVPAHFDEAAKNATKLAANLAGLEVLRLINEPTAAALAYGLDNAAEGIYCVFDLGGGTFDVSILRMQKGVFKVLGVSGDNALGGDDIDQIIAKHLEVDLIEAKKIKEELSSSPSIKYATKQKQGATHSSFSLNKAEFEKLIAEKIDKTVTLTTNLIEDLELEIDEIKGVILVGGSTRIPLIKEKLAAIFGEQKILNKLDPDRIVAAGAAWQAHNLSGNSENLLLDVVPLSLGIEMMGGIVDKIIMRNSAIPMSATKEFTTYADNQTGIKFHIVQGERELAQDCRSLAEFEIKKIPAMKAGLARVSVTFKIDADGLLTVTAKEKYTGEVQEIIVKPSYGIDENEVKKMLLDSLKNSKFDMENRLLIQAITDAKHDIDILKKDLSIIADEISEDEKVAINQKINELEKLIIEKTSRDAINEAQENLGKAAEKLILQKVNAALKEKVAGKKVDEF